MKTIPASLPPGWRRASVLALVLIMTLFLTVTIAALLSTVTQESRLTGARLRHQIASNAVDSAVNYGCAQIVERFRVTSNLAPNSFNGGVPLVTPTTSEFTGWDITSVTSSELRAGTITTTPLTLISPNDPANEDDEFKGLYVNSRVVPLLAKVTLDRVALEPTVMRAKARLLVRDAPLFNYAIFYNNIPLEIAPGRAMTISGPVRSNSPLYMQGSGFDPVHVLGTMMTSGGIFASRHPDYPGYASNPALQTSTKPWHVPYRDADGDGFIDDGKNGYAIDPKTLSAFLPSGNPTTSELITLNYVDPDTGLSEFDSRNPAWKDTISQLTDKYVQDSAHGVPPALPVGVGPSDDMHFMIDPPATGTPSGNDAVIEAQKYSNKAGLYLVVEPDGVVSSFQNAAQAKTYKAIAYAPRSGVDSTGNPIVITTARDSWKTSNPGAILVLPDSVVTSAASKTNPPRTFLDRRENKTVSAVDIDLAALRTAVGGSPTADQAITTGVVIDPVTGARAPWNLNDTTAVNNGRSIAGWNGVMYVDVETPAPASGAALTAVRLFRGDQIPDRSGVSGYTSNRGFTLATNAPAYTLGNLNSDGDMATGNSTDPDGPFGAAGKPESVCCVAADSVTVLSNAWRSADGTPGSGDTAVGSGVFAAQSTEISSAFITGIVRTGNKNSSGKTAYSGGVENFPRLLEDWGAVTLRIRGSMVCLYDSKYALGPWNGSYYGVPALRDWGFSSVFKGGTFPPGTPQLRSYRRVAYRVLTEVEYQAELAKL